MKRLVPVLLGVLMLFASAGACTAVPSSDFRTSDGDNYDSWGICRTKCWGEDGFFQVTDGTFRPVIVFESLGGLKEKAGEVGERLARQYSDRNELAEQIFYYSRNRVAYTPDVDQFGYDDFARNADEMAWDIESKGSARGDCEDYAILLAVMFKAAGLRSAVVLAPEHAAALVYLPDYPGANTYWEFKGEKGWVWAEATGRTNPLGWTPSKFMRSDLYAYEIREEDVSIPSGESEQIASGEGGGLFFGGSPFLSMLLFLWLLSLLGRRRR
jgi:hypothetical protein